MWKREEVQEMLRAMKFRDSWFVIRGSFILCAISAVLLILSFPNFNLSFLAYFAFVPLFFAVGDKKPSQAFLFGYITGLIFFLGSMHWLIHVTSLGLILLSLYLALYFALFTFFLRTTNACPPKPSNISYGVDHKAKAERTTILIVPATWVTLEYIRATFATGIGWSLLGYSQYKNLPIIQIADIAGPYGVSFLVMMANIVIYHVLRDQWVKWSSGLITRSLDRSIIQSLFIFILCIIVVSSYGHFKLSQNPEGNVVKVSVIQGNIPQHQKWDTSYSNFIFDRYEILTKVASTDEPRLIIWPETAFPGYFGEDKELTQGMRRLAKEVQIPILFGAPFLRTTNDERRTTNTAVLLDRNGRIAQQYIKLHLVPFGEYVPFEKYLSFVHNLAPFPIAGFTSGKEYTVFTLSYEPRTTNDERRFSVLICFEDIFPSLSRRFVQEGAILLVNMTNDAWFKETSAPYQHVQASVFRAVENRVNVVRAANTGLSCFIDSNGKILSRIKDRRGKDIFIEGYETQTLEITEPHSFYTKYGDLFAFLCIVTFLIALFRRAKSRP